MTPILYRITRTLALTFVFLIGFALAAGHVMVFPDNELVFEADLNTGYHNIYRMDIVHGLIHPMTNDRDYTLNSSAIWSPDGQQVAFVSQKKQPSGQSTNTIYIMDAYTQTPYRLADATEYASILAWSSDGRFIVHGAGLQTINLETGTQEYLTRLAADSPVWSPDGLQIAFTSRKSNADIYTINVRTGDFQPMVSTPADDVSPVWSPDSRFMVYASGGLDNSGIYGFYHLNIADGKSTLLYRPDKYTAARLSDWSSDGRFILYTAYIKDYKSGIFRLDVTACLYQPENCVPQLITSVPALYKNPHWRPAPP